MHRWGNKKDMAGDDPPYLTVGTEVSAKYKGAFCEAKIRKVVKTVKCKVQYKNEQGSAFVNDDQIKGMLMPGASIEVKQPEKKEPVEGTIVKIQDLSQYTVVFDDGDIATLRRTALCLKSGRHFAEGETLDQLPLTHPEHFSTPVVSGARGSRRRDDMDDNSDDEEKREAKVEREEDMGKVVCVEIGDKKKSKDNWFPGLIVAPNAQDSVKIDVEDEYLVRSFKDGRYYTVPKTETMEFTREVGGKVENPTLKQAVEKAISFLDKSDLPPHWDRDQLFGMADFPSDIDASDTDSMDDEPREEKDHFVAQLYKFMDDRGTPINKGPMISSKDVDLYKLFKIVYKLGGYNRVTNRNQWKSVAMKLGYNANQTSTVKSSYKKYLHSFEDFYRKLGCTLLTTSRDNKLRSRSNRSLIRDRDKALPDKLLDKDENSLSNNEDSLSDLKETNGVKLKSIDEQDGQDEEDVDPRPFEIKKELMKPRHRDHSSDSVKEEEKPKKKLDSNATKDAGLVQLVNFKESKEDKITSEKRTERKSVKSVPKADEISEKKVDKTSVKTKNKKCRPIERRIRKAEGTLSQMKEKRSLKDRMKAIVHKLKLKSANSNEQEKKKKAADVEVNKLLQHGVKVRLKDELANNVPKSRKLSVGSNDSKNSTGAGPNSEKKSAGSSSSASSVSDAGPGPGSTLSKFKKSDEEIVDGPKKKTASRKKRDDDKFSTSSADLLMNQAIEFVPLYKTICIGDKLKVYYEPTHESKVTYEAKVTNKRYGAVTEYLVHYTGWNTRYDEWIRRSRIADNLSWTPLRAKRKGNQFDSPSRNPPLIVPVEQLTLQNQNCVKTPTEKLKRSSLSPVVKNRTKNTIKSGIKQMKNMKSKFESKSKKASAQKDSDSGSESDSESNRKRPLQKTRSRTERKKQQDEESTNMKDVAVKESKKAPPTLKRTRSGSIKLENKDTAKKRKMSPSSKCVGKASKTSSIRNSIIKSLVLRRRMSDRAKDLKEEKSAPASPVDDDKVPEDEIRDNETVDSVDEVKCVGGELEKKAEKSASCDEPKNPDEKMLTVKIRPISPEKIAEFELSPEDIESDVEVNETESAVSSSEDTGPPVLKKEILVDEETSPVRTTPSQFLPGSYLSENLDTKPKIVKAKLKKDADEKIASPSKTLICRSPSEKPSLVAKPPVAGDVKEKTFFTSRSPSEKKNEKTPEKDVKLRNVNTFTSYLSMDKIECMKKVIEKGEKEKQLGSKTVDSVHANEEDIYEFKEPEPFEFRAIDDRVILHRRSTMRIFEDANYKRPKMVASAVDVIMKEIDEQNKSTDDMNIVETKSILEEASKFDESVRLAPDSGDSVRKKKTHETETLCVGVVEANETPASTVVDESMKANLASVAAEADVGDASPMNITQVEKCLLPTLATTENFEDSEFEECVEDDDDAEESKLVILENEVATDVAVEETSSKPFFDNMKPVTHGRVKLEIVENSLASNVAKSVSAAKESARKNSSPDVEPLNSRSRLSSDNEEDFKTAEASSASVDESNDVTEEPLCQTPVPADKDLCMNVLSSEVSDERMNVCDSSNEKLVKTIINKSVADSSQVTTSSSLKPVTATSSKAKTEEKLIVGADEPGADQLGKADSTESIVLPDGIVAEIEIEVSSAAVKKDADENLSEVDVDKTVESKSEKSEGEHSELKDDEDAMNDGLLLCEETIPKSPESKDTNDMDMPFSNSSRIAIGDDGKKLPHKQRTKLKKEPRSAFASPGSNAFENTPPSTPEGSNSTPGTSPSEEISGFSSTTFSLNEKSCSNKDSSENETSSDASEKPIKVKKYSDEAYAKKNAFEFDTYLKRKAEQEAIFKAEEPIKKKSKSCSSPSANGSDKDDFSDSGSSPKTVTSPQKSLVANLLMECPTEFDANQRIEFLEQKLQSIRKSYNSFKQEVASIDKRRKKLRRREREGRMMTRNEANSLL